MQKNNKLGFTLLELLIALFIFSMIAVITTNALHTTLTSQARTETHAQRIAQIQMALLLMSRDFQQVVNRPITNNGGGIDQPFIGTTTSAIFTHAGYVNPQGQLTRSTLQRTRYRLSKNRLIREIWPVLDQTSTTIPTARILLTEVNEVQFQYLDKTNRLLERWPPPDQTSNEVSLPKAVRITLVLNDLGKLSQFYVIPIQPKPTTPS